jgi:hypothetical protein
MNAAILKPQLLGRIGHPLLAKAFPREDIDGSGA